MNWLVMNLGVLTVQRGGLAAFIVVAFNYALNSVIIVMMEIFN